MLLTERRLEPGRVGGVSKGLGIIDLCLGWFLHASEGSHPKVGVLVCSALHEVLERGRQAA